MVRGLVGRGALAMGAALMVVSLAACSDSGSGANSTGTLAVGTVAPPSTLDPALAISGGDFITLRALYDRLLINDPVTLEPKAGLATEWAFNADHTEFSMTLRDDVKFQDGTDFNADAVKVNLERYTKLGKLDPITTVSAVKVVDDTHVVLEMSADNAFLPAQLMGTGGMMVSPKAVAAHPDDVSVEPVGSGRYTFKSQVPGTRYEFTRTADHWSGTDAGYSAMTLQVFETPVSLVQALQTGTIQFADRLPSDDVKALDGDDRVVVSSTPSLRTQTLAVNSAKPVLKDQRVRQALNFAIDRAELAEVGEAGLGKPVAQIFPPDYPLYSDKAAGLVTYDPTKAKQLLSDAGVSSLTLNCVTYTGSGWEALSPFIIGQLKEVGITMKLQTQTLAEVSDTMWVKKEPDCFLAGWAGQLNPYATLYGVFGKDSLYNAADVDVVSENTWAELRAAYDVSAQKAIAEQISVAGIESAATYLPLFTRPKNVAMAPTVSDYVPDLLEIDLANLKPSK